VRETVSSYIRSYRILQTDRKVLVAVSGGADSMALLLVLKELGYSLIALHCNFHLRGEESDRDETFVVQQCKNHGIDVHVQHFDTRAYASEHQISIEMAARDLRYDWFRTMKHSTDAQAIAVAHHLDDQAETLLLHLIRGTGFRGMAAMHPLQDDIARPLLCVTRCDILHYLEQKKQSFVTDSTNLERDALRNRIRLDVLPLLKTLNPNISNTLARTTDYFRQALPLFQHTIDMQLSLYGISDTMLDIPRFNLSHDKEFLLHEWLREKGFTPSQEKEILLGMDGMSGRTWQSTTHILLHDRQRLLLQQRDSTTPIPTLLVHQVEKIGPTTPNYAYVDADKVHLPLTLRQVRQGDRFTPFGMNGSRLVSDFLTDLKRSRFEKQSQLVACSGEEIVWVVGLRSDNRFRITPDTRKILMLEIQTE